MSLSVSVIGSNPAEESGVVAAMAAAEVEAAAGAGAAATGSAVADTARQ